MNAFSTKAIFIISLTGGAFIYLLSAFQGVNELLLHLIPILSMLLYASIVCAVPKSRRDVSDADNAYFMGFIFTMISLGIALYQIQTDKNDNIDVSRLVQSFGIALSSTIVGIFLRILISPRRQDIDAEETSARLALQESVVGFSQILDESTRNVKLAYESHTTAFTHSISKASETLTSGIDFFNDNASRVFQEMIDLLGKSLPKTLDNVNESFSHLCESVDRNTQKIQNTLDVQLSAIVKTNELIKEHSENLGNSSKLMLKALDTLTDRISNVNIDRETIELHVKSVFVVYEAAAKSAATSLTATTESLRNIIEQLTELPVKLDIYLEAKDRQHDEIKSQMEQAFLNLSDLLNRNLGLFQNLPNTLEYKIKPIVEVLNDSNKTLNRLQEIPNAIDAARKDVVDELELKINQSHSLMSNIYSATYEILQGVNASKVQYSPPPQESKTH